MSFDQQIKELGEQNLSSDAIRATVTGTPGSGKAITDDGASGLAWGTAGSAPSGTGFVSVTSGTYNTPAALVAADIPSLAASKITSGVFAIGRLATGSPDGTKFVRDDGTLASPSATTYALVAKKTDGQVLAASGNRTLTWDSATTNSAGFTVASSVFTATVAGWYLIRAVIYAATGSTGQITLNVNSLAVGSGNVSTFSDLMQISELVYLAIGDAFYLSTFSSGSATIVATQNYCNYLRVVKVA